LFTGTRGLFSQPGVIAAGSTLYGSTTYGGSNNDGFVYSMNLDGTSLNVLHDFTGKSTNPNPPPPDVSEPATNLTIVGSCIFGTTTTGGAQDLGTIFSMNLDGTDYRILHQFSASDGARPNSALVQIGSQLFGTAAIGGLASGTLFSIDLDGSHFQV